MTAAAPRPPPSLPRSPTWAGRRTCRRCPDIGAAGVRSSPRPMICLLPSCRSLPGTSRMLAIGRALEARGADVRFATHGGPYEWILRDAGVEYHLLGGDDTAAQEA